MHCIVEGIVVSGDRRGHELGFPTANIVSDASEELPSDGVYAGFVTHADGSIFRATISVGHRPTFYGDDGSSLVEAHLLDFDGDLYGEKIVVELTHHLRNQDRFEHSSELVEQIRRDVAEARTLLDLPRVRLRENEH